MRTIRGFTIFVAIFILFIPALSVGAEPLKPALGDDDEILTPKPNPAPRINGPLVYGCRPDHPFLYRIPCQGERPIHFSVKGLPPELKLDPTAGITVSYTHLTLPTNREV